MNDEEVEFGAVRETVPGTRRRPDLDGHYAVVACGIVDPTDLPIFVEVDAWREMIDHACGDTTVELGGVLLGGIFHDEIDQPFVLVSDSLRAEHYEATRGSFKFTHETWEAITRRRAQFADDVGMVGWYHTHPDWGVFLSSMDLFICDHFFSKPLDVALVIDPCRADWGFFQWTARAGQPPRRTSGFYLIAARTRQAELEQAAAVFTLSGGAVMPADPRWTTASLTAPGTTPVVHIHQAPATPGAASALWFVVIVQGLLLALLGWRVVATPSAANATVAQSDELLQRWLTAQRAEARFAAQSELMDRVLTDLNAAPEGTFQQLTELQEHNVELQSSVRAQQSRERELLDQVARQAGQAKRDRQSLESKLDASEERERRLRKEFDEQTEKLVSANRRLKSVASTTDEDGKSADALPWYRSPTGLTAGAAVAVAALAAGWWVQQRRTAEAQSTAESAAGRDDES